MLQKIVANVASKLDYYYKFYVLRDSFLWNVKKWFADRGDETLRLDYPLDQNSIVFDVGGYRGDYAEAIHNKYGCNVYIFEPVQMFYDECVKRFSNNTSIKIYNYGLSSTSSWFEMSVNNDKSSFKINDIGSIQQAQLRSFTEVVAEIGVERIDLIKINIEGGEFDLLPAMIDSGLINRIKFIQVQFHNFVAGAFESRLKIRNSLEKTHTEMWNYEFVWESWELH